MTYELWTGDVCLGRTKLEFPQCSPVMFSGEFTAEPAQEAAVADMAINIDCVASWMQREARDSTGDYIVRLEFRQSRLFTTIGETLAGRFDPSLHLRRPDGTVIPIRHLAIRDMEQLTLYSDLIAEAIGAVDDAQREPDGRFNVNPEARELFDELHAEWEEEDRANAWRGDTLLDAVNDEAWKAELEAIARMPRGRFKVHVVIEHEGDIPADTTWME
ncbi:hypothetical protein [Gemmatimonas sp.]|uniref:hypothetical protein n=1 Tax=Gemmatimonas sp. TaxID=1962908 RepID=UPI00286B842F|nr:hypothetical protein [Gemmatimonas sp.]